MYIIFPTHHILCLDKPLIQQITKPLFCSILKEIHPSRFVITGKFHFSHKQMQRFPYLLHNSLWSILDPVNKPAFGMNFGTTLPFHTKFSSFSRSMEKYQEQEIPSRSSIIFKLDWSRLRIGKLKKIPRWLIGEVE